MTCPICGAAGASCGGPSHARPVDLPVEVTDEVTTVAEREMVMVHVDDGTERGQDFKFERKDAERYLAGNPSARIVEAGAVKAPAESAAEPAEAKAVPAPPENKSRARKDAEDK